MAGEGAGRGGTVVYLFRVYLFRLWGGAQASGSGGTVSRMRQEVALKGVRGADHVCGSVMTVAASWL